MKSHRLLVECLEERNVDYVFGIPGEQTIPIMNSLRKSDINFVTTRHEQGASFMADVYSRVTGEVGVCLSTLGPGATNLVTGLASSNLDYSSVVAITSQRSLDEYHKETHQFVDVTSMLESVTEYSDTVRDERTIPEQVEKAFRISETGKGGCTHIEVPKNISEREVDEKPIKSYTEMSETSIRSSDIESISKVIESSVKPVAVCGRGVHRKNASQDVKEFLEAYNIPAVTTFMGKESLDFSSKCFVGTIGFSPEDYHSDILKQADTAITLGYDHIEYSPDKWVHPNIDDIVHIGIKRPEVDSLYEPDVSYVGSISEVVNELISSGYITEFSEGYRNKYRAGLRANLEKGYKENKNPPFTPQQIVREIREATNTGDTVISDVGSHKYWLSRRYPVYKDDRFIVSNGFASMGISLPASIACDLATDNNVVSVNGDGGFLMNFQELETATRMSLSPVIIVLEDGEYTAISMEQESEYGQKYASSFDDIKLENLDEIFDINSRRVTRFGELNKYIQEAFNSDKPTVITVPIDETESYKLESQN